MSGNMPQVETIDRVSIAPNNIEISNDTSLRIGASALENSVLQFGDSRDVFRTLLGDIGISLDQPGEIRATLNDLGEFAGKPCAINNNGFHIANTLNTLIGINRLATDKKNDEALKSEIATKVNQIVQELDKRDSSIRTTSLTSNIGFFSYDALGGLLKEFPLTTAVSDKLAERIDAAAHRYSNNLPIEKVKEYLFGIFKRQENGKYDFTPGLLDASVQIDANKSSPFSRILKELDQVDRSKRNIDTKFDILNLVNDALDNSIIIRQGSVDTIDSKFLQLMIYAMKKFNTTVETINAEYKKNQDSDEVKQHTTKLRELLDRFNQTFTRAENVFALRLGDNETKRPSVVEVLAQYNMNKAYQQNLLSAQQRSNDETHWAKGKFVNIFQPFLNTKKDAPDTAQFIEDISNAVHENDLNRIGTSIIRTLASRPNEDKDFQDSLQLLDYIYSVFQHSGHPYKKNTDTANLINSFIDTIANKKRRLLENPFFLNLYNNIRKVSGLNILTLEQPENVTEALKR